MRLFFDRLSRPQAISNTVLVLALIAMCCYFMSRTSRFATGTNLMTLVDNAAALGIMVVPFTMLVIAGYIDFSVGSAAALAATLAAVGVTQWQWSEPAGLALALAIGAAIGAMNGFLCVVLSWNPIIVTLGMLGAVRGITLLIQQDQIFGIGPVVEALGSTDLGGIPLTTVLALLAFVVGGLFLVLTPWGRHIFALGANPQAAYLSALRVQAIPFVLYVATGICAALAGIVFMARLNGVSPATTADGMEFEVLTIALLGGVAFAGGRGNLFGVFVAWLFLAALKNGLVLLHVTPYVQTVAAGLALVLAAALDRAGATLVPRLQAWRETRRRVVPDPHAVAAAVAA
ncbi:ABC transporter permease [Nocardia higoensis]|uniref:ABC transporter permease n=1 Tax=Nocardia higoensis TaxID=228599 RepID=UPI0002EF740B|nr:ABC transporter permease [Nocardia higoensis]